MLNFRLRTLILPLVASAPLACAPAVASAATPPLARAPGRVLLSVDRGAVSGNVDGGRAAAAVALPDGGSALVGSATGRAAAYAAELTADGH